MFQQDILICNKLGLHARAAAKLVALTTSFSSEIYLQKEDRKVNAKSIMGVMMLAASKGTELILFAEGEDELAAINAIEALVNNRFEEDE
ncbi:MAG: HPr family phosphocarrier protein [Gammaproteobacteria bacterium]|nr:HPr family phosphocarrier protein [Gammaproteobacteria bacterium]